MFSFRSRDKNKDNKKSDEYQTSIMYNSIFNPIWKTIVHQPGEGRNQKIGGKGYILSWGPVPSTIILPPYINWEK